MKKGIHDTTIKDAGYFFRLKKENESIKDKTIRGIKNFFENEEEDYYKPVRVNNFGVTITLNMKVMGIKIKHYQLQNVLIN